MTDHKREAPAANASEERGASDVAPPETAVMKTRCAHEPGGIRGECTSEEGQDPQSSTEQVSWETSDAEFEDPERKPEDDGLDAADELTQRIARYDARILADEAGETQELADLIVATYERVLWAMANPERFRHLPGGNSLRARAEVTARATGLAAYYFWRNVASSGARGQRSKIIQVIEYAYKRHSSVSELEKWYRGFSKDKVAGSLNHAYSIAKDAHLLEESEVGQGGSVDVDPANLTDLCPKVTGKARKLALAAIRAKALCPVPVPAKIKGARLQLVLFRDDDVVGPVRMTADEVVRLLSRKGIDLEGLERSGSEGDSGGTAQ